MARQRDSQRSKFFSARSALTDFSEVMTPMAARDLIKRVAASSYMHRRYPELTDLARGYIEINIGGKLTSSHSHIQIPKTAHSFRRADIATEIARVIFYRRDPGEILAWYGWEFAAIFRDVVHVAFSPAVAGILEARYKALRVRSAPKATRRVTPEMLERLARAREAIKPRLAAD